METSIIKLEQPNGNEATAVEMYGLILSREQELKAEYAAITAKLDTDAWAETKGEWARLNRIDDELKHMVKATEQAAFKYAKAEAVLVQLKATRKNLAAIHDAAWEKFCALRDADKPVEPPSTFIIELTARGKDFESIIGAIVKKVGKDAVRWGKAATDKAFVAVKAALKECES